MSIHFISGKPGGGKSLYAVSLIFKYLKDTTFPIVTNVPLKLDNLQEYLHEQKIDIHVHDRVRILSEDETKVFWRARGFETLPPEERDGEINFSLLKNPSPVIYFIDEIHLFFNSREWQKTGKTAIRYLSQHRHLGDDVYCITQSIANVDKQFRSLAQDFTYLRNFRAESWGYFKAPNKFQATCYLTPAESAETHIAKEDFKLDTKGLANCYDTAGGVGMPGNTGGDKGKRAKGLPTWSFFLILLALGFGGWYLISVLVPKLISGHVTNQAEKKLGFVKPNQSNQSNQPQSFISTDSTSSFLQPQTQTKNESFLLSPQFDGDNYRFFAGSYLSRSGKFTTPSPIKSDWNYYSRRTESSSTRIDSPAPTN